MALGLWLGGVMGESAANPRKASQQAEILRVAERSGRRLPLPAEKVREEARAFRLDYEHRDRALFFLRKVVAAQDGPVKQGGRVALDIDRSGNMLGLEEDGVVAEHDVTRPN